MDISSIIIRRNLSKNFLRLTFLFALLLYITSFSQNIEPRFEHITVKDGLPEHTVVSILQDNLGYMWFSTQSGLVRYDGYEMLEYMNGNSWLSLYEDRNKDLWAGSWADGLYRFNRASESFDHYFHKDSDKFSISSDVIHSMFEDSKGRFWIATAKGLELFDRKAKKFRHFNFTDRIYSNELKSSILKSSNSNKRIASILKVGNNADLFHTFKLKKRTTVMIVMMGEAGYDYGWLTDSDGKIIFDYDYEKTLHAGGEFNNRIQIELITLDEGIYQLHYIMTVRLFELEVAVSYLNIICY